MSFLDIDECTLGSAKCSDICTNTYGSYKCNCTDGYELFEDGFTCTGMCTYL